MGQHRMFHRRQAQAATRVLTVDVEVVATVDSGGKLVAQETVTHSASAQPTILVIADSLGAAVQPVSAFAASAASAIVGGVGSLLPAPSVPAVPSTPPVPSPAAYPALPPVPSVPPFPTASLPVVPSVPPFPSDLRVPPYPYSSDGGAQALAASTTPFAYSASPSSAAVPVFVSVASSLGFNSTTSSSSSLASTSSFTSLLSSSSLPSASVSGSLSSSILPSSRLSSSDASASSESQSTASPLSSIASDTAYYGGATGGGGAGGPPAATAAPPAQSTVLVGAAAGASGGSTPLETPQVVGSVVGSLAGAALILAIILLLLRRHKRKQRGALQLTEDEHTVGNQPMTQDLSRSNRIPSAFLNRFSGMSRSTVETNTSGAPSFQRISGRKLPSAFSEGMTSEQFARGGHLSGASSFYQDDQGTYGSPGVSKEFGKDVAAGGAMNIRPGPGRTPVIRHPDDESNPFADPAPFPRGPSHLSPPQSPNPELRRGTLGRSLVSQDGSRSSKFTENV
jgi:hypothetical protein